MLQLMWFRTDLRVMDNRALSAAMQTGPSVAVFLLSPTQWRLHDAAPCKVDFWLRNLRTLEKALDRLGVPLLVRIAERWVDAPQVLTRLAQQLGATALHWNDEYGVDETRRDLAVSDTLNAAGIACHRHLDRLLLQPGSLLTRSGSFFKVYSQFRKACQQRLQIALPALTSPPRAQSRPPINTDKLPTRIETFETANASWADDWPAGEDAAQTRLQHFADQALEDYQDNRNLPAQPGTSKLSAYLAAGVLSPRQCLHAALVRNQGEFSSGHPGVLCWINELLWREFYNHLLVGYPQLAMHHAMRPQTEALPWRAANDELLAWQQGHTGFPIIDAAMRQLQATGWMHNRLRMLTAMFLSKNLLIDWRLGERFFMRHLIDGDLAANNGGWQWSASTGSDSVPYFRLFNPISQSERYDPDGSFIRRWLPELAHLPSRSIHNPYTWSNRQADLLAQPDYPAPIIDLSKSRARALKAFKQLSSDDFQHSTMTR
jgi:deoxyribodipyrimidine photo-lyase